MKTNDKIKAVAEEFEEEFAPFIAECFHYDTGHSIAPLARKQKKWLQHRLETLVREEKEELLVALLKSLPLRSDWDDDEKVTFSMAVGAMREVLESYRPPITNNKN